MMFKIFYLSEHKNLGDFWILGYFLLSTDFSVLSQRKLAKARLAATYNF
jgi:hypothetical protein